MRFLHVIGALAGIFTAWPGMAETWTAPLSLLADRSPETALNSRLAAISSTTLTAR